MQPNESTSAQGLVIAEEGVLAEAQDVFSRMGTPVETATFDSIRALDAFWKRSSESYCFIVLYVRDVVPEEFSAALRNIKHVRNHHLLLYVPHHGMNLAFNIGLTVGREWGKSAEIASNIR